MINPNITEADALRQFPELSTLVTLRRTGWIFRPIEQHGELVGLAGSYSRRQYTDAIFVFDRTNVSAARVLDEAYGGGCVWKKERSGLREVVHELLVLPEPGEPGAPILVTRSGLLWTP
jgi:hypothetical protein